MLYFLLRSAGVAELVDAADLKDVVLFDGSYGQILFTQAFTNNRTPGSYLFFGAM